MIFPNSKIVQIWQSHQSHCAICSDGTAALTGIGMRLPPPVSVLSPLARSHDNRSEQLHSDEQQTAAAKKAERDLHRLWKPSDVINETVFDCFEEHLKQPQQQHNDSSDSCCTNNTDIDEHSECTTEHAAPEADADDDHDVSESDSRPEMRQHVPSLSSQKFRFSGTMFAYHEIEPPQLQCHGLQHAPSGPADTTLVFESRFEGGNLQRAVKVYEDEYDLILRPDINTRGHAQWFFFSMSNTRRFKRYVFSKAKQLLVFCHPVRLTVNCVLFTIPPQQI